MEAAPAEGGGVEGHKVTRARCIKARRPRRRRCRRRAQRSKGREDGSTAVMGPGVHGRGKEKSWSRGCPEPGRRAAQVHEEIHLVRDAAAGEGTFGVATETRLGAALHAAAHAAESTIRTSWRPAQQFSQQPSAQQTARAGGQVGHGDVVPLDAARAAAGAMASCSRSGLAHVEVRPLQIEGRAAEEQAWQRPQQFRVTSAFMIIWIWRGSLRPTAPDMSVTRSV